MELMDKYLISWIVFLPLLGAGIILLLDGTRQRAIRTVALFAMIASFLVSIQLFLRFDSQLSTYQFVQRLDWIPAFKITYQVGVDGISLLLVMLTTLLGPLVILSSWSQVSDRVKEYHVFMLLMQTGMLGAFAAMDLFLFYVFWELMLIPMYFLIGVWGGPRRIYAAIKFFLFTMFGSVLMLIAIIYLYFYAGNDFDLIVIMNKLMAEPLRVNIQLWLFAAFALAFAIKVPMFPFHTWLPDAHVEAPTAGSVILAGVLLKMGTYGFIRFAMPFFPEAAFQAVPVISVLALIGIIYGALVSMVQDDIKKMVAYSSVSHLGFVMLGLFALTPQAVSGALIQMVNHGLSTGALFLLVGIIYERRHTRLIHEFGGVSKPMPIFAAFFLIVCLSSIGLPGLNGFIGEFLILLGTYTSANPHAKLYAVLAATGVIFAAVYLLWMFQRVMFGPCSKPENQKLKDVNAREILYLAVLLVFIVWIGVYPRTFLSKAQVSVDNFVSFMHSHRLPELPPPAPAETGEEQP